MNAILGTCSMKLVAFSLDGTVQCRSIVMSAFLQFRSPHMEIGSQRQCSTWWSRDRIPCCTVTNHALCSPPTFCSFIHAFSCSNIQIGDEQLCNREFPRLHASEISNVTNYKFLYLSRTYSIISSFLLSCY